ncbi:MAG: hypothetical protein B6D58_07100 [candidate division Zixibacteria bacterium 4484_95]|nr:MAG: hypothetical protein B6D58_07100 [candidate division Zixibacteria bacterium 4484_95]
MKKVLAWVPIMIAILVISVFGQVSQTAVPFLLIAPGARAGGMGETFVAISDDATATHWNPAGLGRYPLSPSWIEIRTDKGEKIENIALVKNDIPEVNYRQYDVWAIINGHISRWNGESWKRGTTHTLEEGKTIKNILLRYTGLEEEQIKNYYDKLTRLNNDIPIEKIDTLQQILQPFIPDDYQYSEEISFGFDKLRNAWNDLKIDRDGFNALEKIIREGLTDSLMTNLELDKIAFGFDQAIRKRSINKIEIPYDLILGSKINCLESHGGMLYTGTDNGFYRFDPRRNRWKSYGLEDSLPSLKITALGRIGRKSIVIGTAKGVVYFNGVKIKKYSSKQNPPSGYITNIAATNDRNIWAAYENDLFYYDGHEWRNYVEHEVTVGEDIDNIINIFYRAMAVIDLEGIKSEIMSFNGIQGDLTVGQKIKLPFRLAFKGKILSLAAKDKNVWIGTQKGVIFFNGKTFFHFGYKEYKPEKMISAEEIAKEFLPGISPEKVQHLARLIREYNNLEEGEMIDQGRSVMVYANALGAPILSIAVHSSKKAYIGTAYGVVEYNDGLWSRFSKPELAKTPTHTIKTESGEMWFATDDKVYILAHAVRQITFMHSNYLVQLAKDLYYDFFSIVYPSSEWGTFGLGITFMSYGRQDRTDEVGTVIGQFNSYDLAITLSYGTKLAKNMSAGLSARYINSHLADVGAIMEKGKGVGFSFAVDGGILYSMNRKMTFASTITNIGPDIAYIDADQADPLPTKLAIAFAYKLVDTPFNKLTFIGEADKLLVDLNDDIETEIKEIIPHIGAEYWYSNYVSLRAGYIYDEIGEQRYLTLGASLQWTNYRFDFSYIPASDERYNRMGNTMRFSMNVGF